MAERPAQDEAPAEPAPRELAPADMVIRYQGPLDDEPLDNRWDLGETVIDYRTIVIWHDRLLTNDYTNLRKLKVSHLPNRSVDLLLQAISRTGQQLSWLDIAVLELLYGHIVTYTFNSLQLLSIQETRVVFEEFVGPLQFEGPYLTRAIFNLGPEENLMKLYLDPHSMVLVHISDCSTVTHLRLSIDPTGEYLARFTRLTVLVCEQIGSVHLPTLLRFVTGDLGALFILEGSLQRLTSTSYQPCDLELAILRPIFDRLKASRRRPGLKIAIHGVQLDFRRTFDEHHFERPLLNWQFSHWGQHQLNLFVCQTVKHTDFVHMYNTFINQPFQNVQNGVAPDDIPQLVLFHQLYPNVQTFSVDNPNPELPLDDVECEILLRRLRYLTKLVVTRAGFPGRWYEELPSYPSLLTLEKLIMRERYGVPVRVNFDFLNEFPMLRFLETNLATRASMLRAVELMRAGSFYEFRFLIGPISSGCVSFRIRKLSEGQRSMWIGIVNLSDGKVIRDGVNVVWPFDRLEAYVNREECALATPHWLDGPVDQHDVQDDDMDGQVQANGQANGLILSEGSEGSGSSGSDPD